MCKLPTIKVKHKEYKYEMIINESDFDSKIHEKVVEKASAPKKAEEPKQPKEIETPKNDEEELKKLIGA